MPTVSDHGFPYIITGVSVARTSKSKCEVKVKTGDAKRLHDHIADRLCRLADAMLRLSAKSIKQTWGLRPIDLRLLNMLDGEQPLAVREISRRVYVDQAWVSRSLRDLESRDLVQRKSDPKDSRLTLVSLTAHGRKALDEVRPYALKSEQFLLNGIDEKKLKALLDKVEVNTERMLEAIEKALGQKRK